MKHQKDIKFISLMTDEYIIEFYNKLNEIGSNKKYPYDLLRIEEDGFIPTYKNIELKLVDPKLFVSKKGGQNNSINNSIKDNKINILLF